MPENSLPNELLKELLNKVGGALALTDKNKNIIWFNEEFKKSCKAKRIKGENLSKLFNSVSEQLAEKIPGSVQLSLPDENKVLNVIKLKGKQEFAVSIANLAKEQNIEENYSEAFQRNLLFQKEFQNILTLLVKENSLNILTEEILLRCVNISRSMFGILVFQEARKLDLYINDPNKHLKNESDLEKEIGANFSFITKWLSINQRSLLAKNEPGNIGYNLTQSLQSQTLVISPCFFDNNLLATIIVGKKEEAYSPSEVNKIEQFAALLSFAISSIRTRELNAALENRLLQAQKLETIGKLTSGMAHDFSNLLSSIFGSLNFLEKEFLPTDNIIRMIDNIESCSIRAKDLTKGLLSYGKPTPKRKELIKPNDLLSEISKVINQTFPKKIIL